MIGLKESGSILAPGLKELRLWMTWKWATQPDGTRFKMPIYPHGRPGDWAGSSTDPGRWVSFEDAAEAAENHPEWAGLAFSLAHQVWVVDLDGCIPVLGGPIEPWALAIIEQLDTYSERSPSGHGVHAIMFGNADLGTGLKYTLPNQERVPASEKRRVEMYQTAHYFTYTNDPVSPQWDLQQRATAFSALRVRVEAARVSSARAVSPPRSATKAALAAKESRGQSLMSDTDIVTRATSSKAGPSFQALMRGETSSYNDDHSTADMALCGYLAFWTRCDPEQMDRIFRTSGLMRDKWDQRRGLETYGEKTVHLAVANASEVYEGADDSSDSFRDQMRARNASKPAALLKVLEQPSIPVIPDTKPIEVPAPAASNGHGPVLWGRAISDVTERRVDWLWRNRIPMGTIGMLDGNPGEGKSTGVADFIGRITTGADWPDGSPCPQGNVIIFGAEDSPERVWKPRLRAAGADLSRVRIVGMIPGTEGTQRMLQLPGDVNGIEDNIVGWHATTIVFDPIMPYISGQKDSNQDQHVRQALTPLADLIERYQATCIMLRHYAKNNKTEQAIYRGLGSIGFIGLSRWGLAVAKVKGEKGLFTLMTQKNSYGPPAKAIRYTIEPRTWTSDLGEEITTSKIIWGEETDDDADDILTYEGQNTKRKDGASMVMSTLLSSGPVETEKLLAAMKAKGISRATAFRARQDLGVKSKRAGYGEEGVWFWCLPGDEMALPRVIGPRRTAPPEAAQNDFDLS